MDNIPTSIKEMWGHAEKEMELKDLQDVELLAIIKNTFYLGVGSLLEAQAKMLDLDISQKDYNKIMNGMCAEWGERIESCKK